MSRKRATHPAPTGVGPWLSTRGQHVAIIPLEGKTSGVSRTALKKLGNKEQCGPIRHSNGCVQVTELAVFRDIDGKCKLACRVIHHKLMPDLYPAGTAAIETVVPLEAALAVVEKLGRRPR